MQTTDLKNSSLPKGTLLYRFNGVPVMAQPGFWPIPFLLTGFLTWADGLRHPKRSWIQRFGAALLAMPVALFADIGHAMAHTISARLADAPMDEILLSSEMPRTLYQNNEVPPRTHIARSLGGPVFSLIAALISLLWRSLSPKGSLSRDLADVSLAGHSFITVASMAPLPMVDGGTIMKWKMVEAGKSRQQADHDVRNASLYLGAFLLGLGALLGLLSKRRWMGRFLAACGAASTAAGFGWLK